VRARRLIAATLSCAALVLGASVLVGSGRAQGGHRVNHTCSAADKQFIDTVSSNLTQLAYWSSSLLSNDAAPGEVARQARSEAAQVAATRPTDPSLTQARLLVRLMFIQYGRAVTERMNGGDPGVPMALSYHLANAAHDVLAKAQPDLSPRGCEVGALLQS
jgi:hypothetical protein